MNTQTTTPRTATAAPAGWPVRFRWVTHPAPGVNYGTMTQTHDGYWLRDKISGAVTMAHDDVSWGRPSEVEFIPFEDITAEQMWSAAAVAERVAQGALSSVAQPVGEFRVPTDEDILAAVQEARDARSVAWAWKVAADSTQRGEAITGQAPDILGLA